MKRHRAVWLLTVLVPFLPHPAGAEHLGVLLPAPLVSTQTQGGPPNFADTYVTPYVASHAGVIQTWRVQLAGGMLNGVAGVPVGIQLKIFRNGPGTDELQVVAEGSVHDPRPVLQARFGGSYPFFANEEAVVEFTDNLPVASGDIIGVTYTADEAAGGYFHHLVDASPRDTRVVLRNVSIGGVIGLTDSFTATLAGMAPPLQIDTVVQVSIDIKPGSFPNSINLASAGTVPVAILSSETFDATTVVPETISVAGARVRLVGKSDRSLCAADDVNGDNRLDLVCHVVTAQFLVQVGDSFAVLEALTTDGKNIRGEDSIRIVP